MFGSIVEDDKNVDIDLVEMANNLRDHPIDDDPLTVLRKFECLRNETEHAPDPISN